MAFDRLLQGLGRNPRLPFGVVCCNFDTDQYGPIVDGLQALFRRAPQHPGAALLIGLFGGMVTSAISGRPWIPSPLRETGLAATLGKQTHCGSTHVEYAIWKDAAKMMQFNTELWAMTKLIVICLGLAFAAEYQMQAHMQPQALAGYLGEQSAWAVPLAVIVGSPAYLDGFVDLAAKVKL